MPIYMDRHDAPGITAQDVVEAHKKDVEIQDKYHCQSFTYWFDQASGNVFCLIEAPDREAVKMMHDEAHGSIPNQIIEVDSSIVEAFLGRIKDPEAPDQDSVINFIDPAFRIIMMTELKNTCQIKAVLGLKKGLKLFIAHHEFIRKAIDRHDGLEAEYGGNSIVATFNSVSNSIQCALDIQEQFEIQNRNGSSIPINVGIGLSAGIPVTESNHFFGDTIELTRYLTYIAQGGGIIISSDIRNRLKAEGLAVLTLENRIKSLNQQEETFLNRMMNIMEKTWNQPGVRIEMLCRDIGLSKSHLYRLLTGLTGYAPSEFIKEFRLRKALELLERKENNISQVALETGFSNPSYFSSCFQTRYGIRPSQYLHIIS